ncbi:hypothetical protein KIN20_010267 [Parelaphostrongylus tenuis]|uniref:Uncharacterized protein n=1 Tax=Parelaphostrongylus tenuis TaxID=148309 RepID=A0AAD5QK67_PARTN|nr:hypothetical protein KIN20_010267 [Parelaphostrongylus tenuis]
MHDDNEFHAYLYKTRNRYTFGIDKSSDKRSRTAPTSALDRSYDEETMMNEGHHRHFFQGDANVEKRTRELSSLQASQVDTYRADRYYDSSAVASTSALGMQICRADSSRQNSENSPLRNVDTESDSSRHGSDQRRALRLTALSTDDEVSPK